jgi:hypothetical protein
MIIMLSKHKPLWIAMALTASYWGYLIFASRMSLSADAQGYADLAGMFLTQGFKGYFETGPHREPLFPLLVSVAMRLGDLSGISWQVIEKFFHLAVILLTQGLMFLVMRRLKMSGMAVGLVLLYFGFSPAMVNSGMSLFSEVLAYPFVLIVVLAAVLAWEDRAKGWPGALLWSVCFAAGALGLIMIKASFEVGYLIFLLPFIVVGVLYLFKTERAAGVYVLLFVVTAVFLVSAACHGYKSLNKKYNGQYILTDRGPWTLYGNTFKRVQPQALKYLKAGLAYVPGEGFCRKRFSEQECSYWAFQHSDAEGVRRSHELASKGAGCDAINKTLVKESLALAGGRPLQYGLFYMIEGLKVFFWESTRIGFVEYPAWLATLYEKQLLKDGLRLAVSALTFFGFFSCIVFLFMRKFPADVRMALFCLLWMLCAWNSVYMFASYLTRYIFPVVPLFLIVISMAADVLTRKSPSGCSMHEPLDRPLPARYCQDKHG